MERFSRCEKPFLVPQSEPVIFAFKHTLMDTTKKTVEERAKEIGDSPFHSVPANDSMKSNQPYPGITIRWWLIAEGMKLCTKVKADENSTTMNTSPKSAIEFAQQSLLAMAEAEQGGGNG